MTAEEEKISEKTRDITNFYEDNLVTFPAFMEYHPKKCNNVKELAEENRFYQEVIKDLTDDEKFIPLSNEDGSEVKTRVGCIFIWYYNNHKKKVELKKLTTYKDVIIGSSPSSVCFMMRYLGRYYNMFYGKIIEILYIQDNDFIYRLTDVNDAVIKTDIGESYKNI